MCVCVCVVTLKIPFARNKVSKEEEVISNETSYCAHSYLYCNRVEDFVQVSICNLRIDHKLELRANFRFFVKLKKTTLEILNTCGNAEMNWARYSVWHTCLKSATTMEMTRSYGDAQKHHWKFVAFCRCTLWDFWKGIFSAYVLDTGAMWTVFFFLKMPAPKVSFWAAPRWLSNCVNLNSFDLSPM